METMEYSIAILDPGTRHLLCECGNDCYRLPRIGIPVDGRCTELLQASVASQWNLHILVLKIWHSAEGFAPLVIAELLSSQDGTRLTPVSLTQLHASEFEEFQRAYLEDLFNGHSFGRFTRLGWIDDAARWVEKATGQQLAPEDGIRQYNVHENATLLRFRIANGRFVWMKATAEAQRQELDITSLLSRLAPRHLPKILGIHQDWNAWLSDGGTGDTGTVTPVFDLLAMARSLASIQTSTVSSREDLLRAGAIDHGEAVLRQRVPELFEYLGQAMREAPASNAYRMTQERLRTVEDVLMYALDRLESLHVPHAVLHGDFHLGNVVKAADGYQFLDWCETRFGCASINFEHLKLLRQADQSGTERTDHDALWNSYRTVWAPFCNAAALNAARVYTPLVAAFSALYGHGTWFRGTERTQPHRQKYARNLARVMDREAQAPALLAALGKRTSMRCADLVPGLKTGEAHALVGA